MFTEACPKSFLFSEIRFMRCISLNGISRDDCPKGASNLDLNSDPNPELLTPISLP